jgi:hypothetical protein
MLQVVPAVLALVVRGPAARVGLRPTGLGPETAGEVSFLTVRIFCQVGLGGDCKLVGRFYVCIHDICPGRYRACTSKQVVGELRH